MNAILKDQDGFLWFGTTSGLNRYDGHSYRVFRKNYNDSTSLPDNSIQSLYELPGGKKTHHIKFNSGKLRTWQHRFRS